MSKEELTTVALNVLDRLTLVQLLSQERGNLMTMRVTQQFIADLEFTEAEIADWGIVANGQTLTWQPDRVQEREYAFTAWRLKKVQDVLRQLDERGGVELRHLALFEKFLPAFGAGEDADLAAELAGVSAAAEA